MLTRLVARASHKRLASSAAAFPSRNNSSVTRLARLVPSRRLPSLATVRHCSYRRHNMCRTQAGVDMTGGGASGSAQGRELLPANVVPRHYHVTLEPDFEKLTFDGTVVIDVDVAEDSSSIAVNTLELDIHAAKVSSDGQTVRCVPCCAAAGAA